jgi:hypothetical protein
MSGETCRKNRKGGLASMWRAVEGGAQDKTDQKGAGEKGIAKSEARSHEGLIPKNGQNRERGKREGTEEDKGLGRLAAGTGEPGKKKACEGPGRARCPRP